MSLNGYYKLRYKVLERDNFTCQLCGQKAPNAKLEVDHIKPRSEGGSDDMANLRTTCFACNHGRGSFTVENHKDNGSVELLESQKHTNRQSGFDEALYQYILKRDEAVDIGDLLRACQGMTKDDIMAHLLRLHKQGLVYRSNVPHNSWFAVDRYSLEYKKK